jgi:ribosomal protein S12 methylthiotransferase accessory factor
MDVQAANRKFKDDTPDHTIQRIRAILADRLGLVLSEECAESAPGSFSARVGLKDTTIGTNGKGTAPAFALAGAYAEFVERIQNQLLFPLQLDLSDFPDDRHGFTYSPDERVMPVADYRRGNPTFYRHLLSLGISYDGLDAMIAQPFFSVGSGKSVLVAAQSLSYVYGTNGMCAGNTAVEALVQGLAEVIERFVMFRCLDGGLSLPIMPLARVRQFSGVRRIYDSVTQGGKLTLQFRDASRVLGFPAIGVILVDRQTHAYHVRWGVHASLEIALERGLTEIFQRKTIETLNPFLTRYSYCPADPAGGSNRLSAFRTGVACYPNDLFAVAGPGWSPGPAGEPLDEPDNAGILRRMVHLIQARGHDILIRDVSFLGFPSYRVIVPGLSEIVLPRAVERRERADHMTALRRLLAQPGEVDEAALAETLARLEEADLALTQDAVAFLRLPLDTTSSLSGVPIGSLLATLHVRGGRYEEAYRCLDRMVQHAQSASYGNLSFHCCTRDLVGALAGGMRLRDAERFLSQFYLPELLESAARFLQQPDDFFDAFVRFRCWECDGCDERDHCAFFRVRDVMSEIERRYLENCPDQEALGAALGL